MNLREKNQLLSVSENSTPLSLLLAFIGGLLLVQMIWSPIVGVTRFDIIGEVLAILFFTVAAVVNFNTSYVEFDLVSRKFLWRRRRGFSKKAGEVFFHDIEDIIIDSEKSGDGGFCFRLQVLTSLPATKPISLTQSYSGGFAYYRQMQNRLQDILRESEATPSKTSCNY